MVTFKYLILWCFQENTIILKWDSALKQIKSNAMIEIDRKIIVTLLLVVKQGLEWYLTDTQMTWKKQPCNYLETEISGQRWWLYKCIKILWALKTIKRYRVAVKQLMNAKVAGIEIGEVGMGKILYLGDGKNFNLFKCQRETIKRH